MREGQSGSFNHYVATFVVILLSALTACSGDTSTSSSSQGGGQTDITQMNLGDVEMLSFNNGSLDISFDDSSQDATYFVVLNSSNIDQGSFTVQMQSSSPDNNGDVYLDDFSESLPDLAEMTMDDDPNPMHAAMRDVSHFFSDSELVPSVDEDKSDRQFATSPQAVGETRSFRVLNSLSSVSSYTEVEARLRYIGEDVLVYVDTEIETVNPDDVLDSDLSAMASLLEGHSLPIGREHFGSESDIDGNGKIVILDTPVLNRFCLPTGVVTGFFFPGDLHARTASNPASFEGEIFYVVSPDSNADYCRTLSRSFIWDFVMDGVLIHEWQHMTSYYQHTSLNGGSSEKSWLNEALSHLAEDIAGLGTENYSRLKLYLDNPSVTLIPSGLPSLAQRGLGYSFIRYMYEQSGNSAGFTKSLLNTSLRGMANVEAAFAGSDSSFDEFPEFYSGWQTAMVLSGTGHVPVGRNSFQARTLDATTGNYTGLCIYCDALDGRGTVMNGPSFTTVNSYPLSISMSSASARFMQINSPGSSLSIGGGAGAELGGAVIRLDP